MYDDILGTIEQKPKLRKKIRLGEKRIGDCGEQGKPPRRKPRPSRGPTVPGIGVGVLKDKDKGLCEDCGEFEDECECEFDLGKLEVEEIMEDDPPPQPTETDDEVKQCTGCDQCETETDDDDCWDAGGEESKPSKP